MDRKQSQQNRGVMNGDATNNENINDAVGGAINDAVNDAVHDAMEDAFNKAITKATHDGLRTAIDYIMNDDNMNDDATNGDAMVVDDEDVDMDQEAADDNDDIASLSDLVPIVYADVRREVHVMANYINPRPPLSPTNTSMSEGSDDDFEPEGSGMNPTDLDDSPPPRRSSFIPEYRSNMIFMLTPESEADIEAEDETELESGLPASSARHHQGSMVSSPVPEEDLPPYSGTGLSDVEPSPRLPPSSNYLRGNTAGSSANRRSRDVTPTPRPIQRESNVIASSPFRSNATTVVARESSVVARESSVAAPESNVVSVIDEPQEHDNAYFPMYYEVDENNVVKALVPEVTISMEQAQERGWILPSYHPTAHLSPIQLRGHNEVAIEVNEFKLPLLLHDLIDYTNPHVMVLHQDRAFIQGPHADVMAYLTKLTQSLDLEGKAVFWYTEHASGARATAYERRGHRRGEGLVDVNYARLPLKDDTVEFLQQKAWTKGSGHFTVAMLMVADPSGPDGYGRGRRLERVFPARTP